METQFNVPSIANVLIVCEKYIFVHLESSFTHTHTHTKV